MEEGFGEEMPPLGAFDGDHIQSKERESSLASNGRFLVGSQEIISLTGSVCLDSSSHHVLPGILECKNQNISLISVDSLEQSWDNPRSNDDMSGMVEELTVRNYDNLNLTMVGISKSSNKVHGRRNQCQGSSVLDRKSDVSEKVKSYENKRIQGDEALELNNSIRRKMLSESGFSQYFMKNTLKAKGLTRQGQPVERYHCESKDQVGSRAASDALIDLAFKSVLPSVHKKSATKANTTGGDGVNLREWLNNGHREVNKVERLNIFKQIVLLVDYSHSQGVSLLELRPSCFSLLASNKVKYLGSSEGREYPGFKPKGISNYGWIAMKRPAEPGQLSSFVGAKQKKVNHQQLSCFPSITGLKVETASFSGKNASNLWYSGQFGEQNQCSEFGSSSSSIQCLPTTVEAEQKRIILNKLLEENWYQSSEKQNDGVSKVSNIYSLGVFLFELLMHFDSERARTSAMMDLHLRILPPNFLLENLEEAGFCLLLLHPDPVSRPSSRQILESNVLNELKGVNDVSTEELTSCIEQEDIGSELLVHFLATLEKHKKKDAFKLVQDIKCLESDIEEIRRRNYMARVSERSCMHLGKSEVESPWVGKMGTLETAYFSMRTRINPPEMDASSRMDSDLLRTHNNSNDELHNSLDPLGSFFDGLSKYAQYSNFKVHGVIRNSKLNNSSNVVCSLSFDRNEDYFAAAGMSKKIKIFDFNSLLNESVDIHYPVIEMSNRSKLSCISWNGYIHNYVASTDYDGIVKLWDASTGQAFMQYMEHGKQAWSVDFCPSYPTKLASGSDDCCVKLWSINERNSLGTIKNAATVCSVQFCTHSTNLLAFGSADYRTYLYDLRNVRRPWCVLGGHEKAISYVKFLDSGTVVTASTDNSLKLWDLQKTSSCSLSTNACCLTFRGHTNEKNFVGLSVADGYITCGSETNEVYVYHKSMQMPIMSHKLGSIEPISGKETNEENGQFVSSVCWRGNSNMLVAASSSGCIKALQLV